MGKHVGVHRSAVGFYAAGVCVPERWDVLTAFQTRYGIEPGEWHRDAVSADELGSLAASMLPDAPGLAAPALASPQLPAAAA